jgi:hypothetical protein
MLAYKAPAVDITQATLPTTLGRITHTLSNVFLGRWGDFGRATIRMTTPTLDNVFPGRWGDFGPSLGIRFTRASLGAAAISAESEPAEKIGDRRRGPAVGVIERAGLGLAFALPYRTGSIAARPAQTRPRGQHQRADGTGRGSFDLSVAELGSERVEID